jgi:FkbM family methyltransferase
MQTILLDIKAAAEELKQTPTDGCIQTKWGGPSWAMCLHSGSDLISNRIRRDGIWEELWLSRFQHDISKLGADGVVLDIGANLGEYGLLAATMGRFVFMVEPMRMNTNRIIRSVMANKWHLDPAMDGRIRIAQAALSCDHGGILQISMNKHNVGGSSVMPTNGMAADLAPEVVDELMGKAYTHSVALDAFTDFIPASAATDGILIKMDAEGMCIA